jgi:hypothetical protein
MRMASFFQIRRWLARFATIQRLNAPDQVVGAHVAHDALRELRKLAQGIGDREFETPRECHEVLEVNRFDRHRIWY